MYPGRVPRITLSLRVSRRARPHRLDLDCERFEIGRSSTAEVQIEDDLVSRSHAEVLLDGGRWLVRDLGSKNGTWLNGRRVEGADLGAGDRIELGKGGPEIQVLRADRPARAGKAASSAPPQAPAVHKAPGPKERPEPRRKAPPPRARPEPVQRRAGNGFPFLPLLGIVAGCMLAFEAFGAAFPYAHFAHPAQSLADLASGALPSVLRSRAWTGLLCLGLYFGLVGCCIQDKRGWPVLILIAGLHGLVLHEAGLF